MASLYIRQDSPYIWLRYYDKHETNPVKKRKSVSTKLLNNAKGWKQARELKKRVETAQVEHEFLVRSGYVIQRSKDLLEGLREYYSQKPQLTDKSIVTYQLAVKHLVKVCGQKNINRYTDQDYILLLNHFRKINLSQNSIAIYTRHLSALWHYWLNQKYVDKNIIKKITPMQKPVEIIPMSDMKKILNYYKKRNIIHYRLIYFLLLTGFRISSALALNWDQVDFKNKLITATNVKAKKIFYFPIHPELETLLKEMKQKEGRVFDYATGGSPNFWRKEITRMFEKKLIKKKYTLHAIRKTFTSYMVNSGVNQSILTKLLDHSSIRVTDSFYTKIEAGLLRDQFKGISFIGQKKKVALK
jgi:integrase/recombinase XerD